MSNINLQLNYQDANDNVKALFILLQLSPTLCLNLVQLNNLTTYIEVSNKYPNVSNVISSNDKILQAINYESDDNNNYWIILSNDFLFIDVAVPLIADLSDTKIFDSLPANEAEILKSLKNYLN